MDALSNVGAGSAALAAIQRSRLDADAASERIVEALDPQAPADVTDIASGSVELSLAEVAVQANVKVLKVQQQMLGQLLDLIG